MAERKISFFVKDGIPCPVCQTLVFREELLTGRGRFIAKNLTQDLRRQYEPIGGLPISPFMYSVSACPNCLISLFNGDWPQMKLPAENIERLKGQTEQRHKIVSSLFKQELDFSQNKTPLSSAATYYLALATYPFIPSKYSPSIKCAISSIRLYWLVGDFVGLYPDQATYWKGIQNTLKTRTYQYLDTAYQKISKQQEELTFFGPDTDRNNGFEGFIYVHHYFQYMAMNRDNPLEMEKTLQSIKRDLSRVFGIGKPSKNRPVAILELVRSFYEDVKKGLEDMNVPIDPEDV